MALRRKRRKIKQFRWIYFCIYNQINSEPMTILIFVLFTYVYYSINEYIHYKYISFLNTITWNIRDLKCFMQAYTHTSVNADLDLLGIWFFQTKSSVDSSENGIHWGNSYAKHNDNHNSRSLWSSEDKLGKANPHSAKTEVRLHCNWHLKLVDQTINPNGMQVMPIQKKLKHV